MKEITLRLGSEAELRGYSGPCRWVLLVAGKPVYEGNGQGQRWPTALTPDAAEAAYPFNSGAETLQEYASRICPAPRKARHES